MGERVQTVDQSRLNPCELEIDLFCRGVRLSPAAESRVRPARRTRAGLGSGVELVLPGSSGDIWVNVPVREEFARRSPYLLDVDEGGALHLCDDRSGLIYPVRFNGEPRWYNWKTSSGRKMAEVGVLQGTYLAVYIGPICRYWTGEPRENCAFCTTGLNEEVRGGRRKSVADVVETAAAARRESGITFVHFNSGYQGGRDLELALPFVRAVKQRTGLLVGLQLAPVEDLAQYDEVIAAGVDHFSFCFEFMSPEAFARFCPGKARTLGQEAFFRAMEYTSRRLGKGRVSGEIIAGLEPVEETLRAIDLITDCGAFPTVCVFRPLQGSRLEDAPPPCFEDMRRIFEYMMDRLVEKRIPIGLAPNLEVSLVVQPTDGLYLLKRNGRSLLYKAYNGLLKVAARSVFAWRMTWADRRLISN